MKGDWDFQISDLVKNPDRTDIQWQPVIKSLSVLYFGYHHHHSILPKGRSFTVNSETKAPVLIKGRSSTANSGMKATILLGMDRCGSFLLLYTHHSLFRNIATYI